MTAVIILIAKTSIVKTWWLKLALGWHFWKFDYSNWLKVSNLFCRFEIRNSSVRMKYWRITHAMYWNLFHCTLCLRVYISIVILPGLTEKKFQVTRHIILFLLCDMFFCGRGQKKHLRHFKALFGVTPESAEELWLLFLSKLPIGWCQLNLLLASHFLKQYCTESNNRIIWSVDKKSQGKWTWIVFETSSNFPVASFGIFRVLYIFCYQLYAFRFLGQDIDWHFILHLFLCCW